MCSRHFVAPSLSFCCHAVVSYPLCDRPIFKEIFTCFFLQSFFSAVSLTGLWHYNQRKCSHLIWLTGIAWCRDWLTDQSTWSTALLWLVVHVIPKSFSAARRNRYPRPPLYSPYQATPIGCYSFCPLWDWPVQYPKYIYIHQWFHHKLPGQGGVCPI